MIDFLSELKYLGVFTIMRMSKKYYFNSVFYGVVSSFFIILVHVVQEGNSHFLVIPFLLSGFLFPFAKLTVEYVIQSFVKKKITWKTPLTDMSVASGMYAFFYLILTLLAIPVFFVYLLLSLKVKYKKTL